MSTPESHPILLCFDRSPGARRAIETVGPLFPGRPTVVLYVWTPISVMIGGYGAVMSLPAADEAEIQATAQEIAAEGARLAVAAGLDATPETTANALDGTWHTILAAADRHDAGLIALGARGLSTFRSMLLGSVSHAVVQHARRPVLVVPPPAGVEDSVLSTESGHADVAATG